MAMNDALENKEPIYIPKKLDKVDMALAEFLNEYSRRKTIQINFIRVASGLYKYGTKRVSLSLQSNSYKVLALVGGSFLPL